MYNNNTMSKCIFKLLKGIRKGELCDNKTNIGSFYCKRHSKETNENETKEKETNETKEKETENEQKINSPIYIITKNKYGNFTFENTGLIFKNINDKKIVAKEGVNGKWLELNDDDIDLCIQYKLKFEKINLKHNFDSKKYTSNISLFDKPIVFEKELQSNNDLRFEDN